MGETKRKHHRGRREKKKSGDIISTLVLIIAVGVLIFSGFKLYEIYGGRYKGNSEYKELKSIGLTKAEDDRYRVNFEKLWKVNKDIKAWIRFEQPEIISYPVVQGKDNDIYLHKTIKGYPNTYGAIFINFENNPDFSDQNTIIYGHRMNGGAMFGQLNKYEDKKFWDKYPCFYIYTPDGAELKYEIYSVGVVKDISETYQTLFQDDAAFERFLEHTKKASTYDTGVEVNKDSKVVTLSTCTKDSNDDRYVVRGVLTEVKKD